MARKCLDTFRQPNGLSVFATNLTIFSPKAEDILLIHNEMSDRSHIASDPAFKSHRDSTVIHAISDATPRRIYPRSKQKQRQQHAQQQTCTDRLTKGQKKRARSKSSSPEKLRPARLQPTLHLPPSARVDTSGWDHSVISSRPRHLAAPILIHNDNDNGFDTQINEIQKRLNGFSLTTGQVPVPYLSQACVGAPGQSPPFFGYDLPYLRSPSEFGGAISPDSSPSNVSSDLNLASATTSPVRDEESEESESPILLPQYASFFRHRHIPADTFVAYHSPLPPVDSIEHALAIKEALTAFHMGVLLVDEWAAEDEYARSDGLRKVACESMPGLKALGIRAHQIVFYYHGRGDRRVGNEVWDAITEWDIEQYGVQRTDSWSSGSGDSCKQKVILTSKQDNLEPPEHESRQQEILKQREAERERLRRVSKPARKWNDFARQEALNSLVHDGTDSRFGGIYEDNDNKKITW